MGVLHTGAYLPYGKGRGGGSQSGLLQAETRRQAAMGSVLSRCGGGEGGCCSQLIGLILLYYHPGILRGHKCDRAVFRLMARPRDGNWAQIGTVNLNNLSDGGYRESRHVITEEQALRMFKPGSQECFLQLQLICDLGGPGACHVGLAFLEIRTSEGEVIFDGRAGELIIQVDVCV